MVPSLDEGIARWEKTFGYVQSTRAVVNERQRVRVAFLVKAGSTTVKLVEPTGPASPVHPLAMRGGGIHHICFRTDDLRIALRDLRAQGAKLLVPPEPGDAFEGEEIAFVFVHNITAEIIATSKKTHSISAPAPDPPSGH